MPNIPDCSSKPKHALSLSACFLVDLPDTAHLLLPCSLHFGSVDTKISVTVLNGRSDCFPIALLHPLQLTGQLNSEKPIHLNAQSVRIVLV